MMSDIGARWISWLLVLGSLLAPLAATAQQGAELKLIRVTPVGDDVPPPAQIVFSFDRDMVPVGRMERTASEVPIRIEPALPCEWRWLDTRALACELDEKQRPAPATSYRIQVAAAFRAIDGAKLAAPASFVFLTQRPAVSRAYFDEWRGPGTPRLLVTFATPVETASVLEHLFFDVQGKGRVAAHVETVETRWDGPALALSPASELPEDAAVTLRVEPGLRASDGPVPGVESRAVLAFATFPRPALLGIRCREVADRDREILIAANGASSPVDRCDPETPVWLRFSAPVIKAEVASSLRVEPDLAGGRTDYDPWEEVRSRSRLGVAHEKGETYDLSLPTPLKAGQAYRLRASAGTIRDELGRTLESEIDFVFATDHRRPGSVLNHPVSVLESDVESSLPIVVTNTSQLSIQAQRITAQGIDTYEQRIPIPNAPDVAFRFPVPLRQALRGRSGAFVGRLDTSPRFRGDPHRFFSQITPFAVHAKLGHSDSLVWVTELASGRAVSGASVEVFVASLHSFPAQPEILASATTDRSGRARLAGTRAWPDSGSNGFYYSYGDAPTLVVRVRKGDDLALLPAIQPFRAYEQGGGGSYVQVERKTEYGHVRAWGTTAQGIYRPGDTVQYALWVRDQSGATFTPAPAKTYTLEVQDPAGKVAHRRTDIELDAFGSTAGEFQVPKSAVTGVYSLELQASFAKDRWYPLEVTISDFTPAPFRVTTELEGERFGPLDEVRVATSAQLHSGGPYGNAQTRIVARVAPEPIEPAAPRAAGFRFDASDQGTLQVVHNAEASVDAEGKLSTAFQLPESSVIHGRLSVESAVRDDRGKSIAASASARYVGRDRFVGLHREGWLLEAGKTAALEALVIDAAGQLASDTPVAFTVQYREVVASRVKGAGNAFLTKFEESWIDIASCTATPTLEPAVCRFEPERAGAYRLSARIADTLGRAHETTLHAWSQGKGQVLWPIEEGYRIDVTPEKTEYGVGDTARFLVRNPFAKGQALITTERLGVISSEVRELGGPTEIVEVEITPDHVPGFYLSVVLTSPRVDTPPPSDDDPEVDLGKPAFRMGYVRVPVRDPVKSIDVEVKLARDTYKPRERVRVDVQASARQGGEVPMRAAVVVIDESVLDLLRGGADRYDPYRGFYELDSLDVENFALLTSLVGRVRFEKKGENAGGDGGLTPELRSEFRFVAHWDPTLELDRDGRGHFELELPDNLTGWRVLVMAVTPEDRFGLGQGRFKVNRPTEVRPALPNQVLEGDRFEARFTVMNRTPEMRRLSVEIAASGNVKTSEPVSLRIEAPPYQRVPVQVPLFAAGVGEIALRVQAGDASDADATLVRIPVRRRAAPLTAATYLSTTLPDTRVPLAIPSDIREDTGEIRVVLSPSVLGGLEGAFEYMRDYPYACWEQRLSKGVMAAHYLALRAYLPASLEWKDADAQVRAMLANAVDFQAPNGGMSYYVAGDAYVSPYLSAYTALALTWLRERGYPVSDEVESRLHAYLQELLRRDAAPTAYSEGMSATVRAVALAALARAGAIDASELLRFRPHVARMDLFGMAHFLEATLRLGQTDLARETLDRIASHANQSGGKLRFVESIDTVYGRLHHTPERASCSILAALAQAKPEQLTAPSDWPPELARFLTQARQRSGRWENTQENVFCMNALVEYARRFESEPPSMTVTTALAGRELGESRFASVRDPAATHVRPLAPGDAGRKAELEIHKRGGGRYYAAVQLQYAPRELASEPRNAGIEVAREYSIERDGEWAVLASPYALRRGDLVRVELFVTVPAARNFVVVDDPLPGALEAVDRNLATASDVDADAGEPGRSGGSYWFRFTDWADHATTEWHFYHREIRAEAVRFYSEYLPPGRYSLTYTAQVIAEGDFQVLPVHAEEMYDPDVAGDGVPATLHVEP